MLVLHDNAGPKKNEKRCKRFETDLKAVLAGIAPACDVHVNPFDWNKRTPPERQGT